MSGGRAGDGPAGGPDRDDGPAAGPDRDDGPGEAPDRGAGAAADGRAAAGSGDGALEISFTLNGEPVTVRVDPRDRLLDTLRYRLGLPGTKEGCGEGECGACTVYLDGLPANSCLVPTYQVRGREVETVEALDDDELAPFVRGGATQCGACTPGVAMTALWLLERPDLLDTHGLRELMAGNLCRCTGYDGIIDSVEAAFRDRGVDLPEADEDLRAGPIEPRRSGPDPGPEAG